MTADLILSVVLIALVLVGIWTAVEVALTMRSARRDVEKLSASAREVIEQAQPVVTKLDGIMDELEPAAKQVTPLLRKTETAVDEATVSLDRLNGILEDVSSVSGAASSVTGAVKGVAESAASGVAGVVSRLRAGSSGEKDVAPRLDGEREDPAPRGQAAPEARYVDYGEVAGAPAGDDPTAADQGGE